MKNKLPTRNSEIQTPDLAGRASLRTELGAFTLVEILVVVTLLSFIVLALMAVFSTTQTAFRASMTQADVLQGGRAVMDLMTEDLQEMSPSDGNSNELVAAYYSNTNAPANFYANTNLNYPPLVQSLVGSSRSRTNILENFFILSRENQTWTGVGYVVDTASANSINPLYRFSMTTNNSLVGAKDIFNDYLSSIAANSYTNFGWSHLIDGVVDLRVRAYDTNGVWMTNGYVLNQPVPIKNVFFLPSASGETGFYMFSNALPASVEIEMATLEDRTLQHAESLPAGSPRDNYLEGQAGKVHVFRQRVSIPNVDPSAYQ